MPTRTSGPLCRAKNCRVREGRWQPGQCFRCGRNEGWDGCRPHSEDFLRLFFVPTSRRIDYMSCNGSKTLL